MGAPVAVLSAEVRYLLPTTVIARLLGVPLEDRDKFNAWVDDINTFHGTPTADLQRGSLPRKVCWDCVIL
jgi:cytochrome P450